jgi:4-hydroxy-tetrahydrodipicolinate synthase
MSLRDTLKGTGVALVTPFKANMEVDYDALAQVIEFDIANGVNYLVTLGTTGETPTLDKNEKRAIVDFTLEKVDKRVPLVIGVGGNNTAEVIKDLNEFPLREMTAVLSAAPYYNKPSQEGIVAHYKAIADASMKPVILYNVPGRTGRNMNSSTTLELAKHANIGGMKEASGDMIQCMQILKDKPEDFLVVSGDDNLALPQLACGMHGVISVAANCFPKQFAEMVRLCLAGNYAEAKIVNDKLLEGYDLLFVENNPAGVKAVLAELGIIQNHLRLPLLPLSANFHKKLKLYLAANS